MLWFGEKPAKEQQMGNARDTEEHGHGWLDPIWGCVAAEGLVLLHMLLLLLTLANGGHGWSCVPSPAQVLTVIVLLS